MLRSLCLLLLGSLILIADDALSLRLNPGPEHAIFFVLWSPLALPALVPGLMGLAGALWQGVRRVRWADSQGIYYEFEGHRFHCLTHLNRFWIDAADLRRWCAQEEVAIALRPAGIKARGRELLQIDQVLGGLRAAPAGPAQRLRAWLENQVVPPMEAAQAGTSRTRRFHPYIAAADPKRTPADGRGPRQAR